MAGAADRWRHRCTARRARRARRAGERDRRSRGGGAFPLVPAVKAVLVARYDNADWYRMRPPLRPLGEIEARKLHIVSTLRDVLGSAA